MSVCADCRSTARPGARRGLCDSCYHRHLRAGDLADYDLVIRMVFPVFVPMPWTIDALCAQVDADLWFPEQGGSSAKAKKICARCLVRAECLDYALETVQQFGVYGGMSEQERRELKRGVA